MRLVMVDARERFLARLAGVTDPEHKRRIIGDEFIRVFEEEAAKLGRIDFLTQGTLYPDVIETTTPETKTAQKIKTHHNVGGLPADLRFQLIEPLRYLFKDEVRLVGTELGLPEAMVQRQPFPGPGLAIRIIGEVTAERLDTLRDADWIVIDEIKAAGLYRSVWQSFAILTPVRSVGVMGDGRTYANVVAIRAVTSEDGMTADWAKLPYDVLGQDLVADRQRGPGRQPRRVRHQQQAARDDRVGVAGVRPVGGRSGGGRLAGRWSTACAHGRPDDRPGTRCPWCSAALPAADLETCPSCGATLTAPPAASRDQGRHHARHRGDPARPQRGRAASQPAALVHHRRGAGRGRRAGRARSRSRRPTTRSASRCCASSSRPSGRTSRPRPSP